MNLSRIFFSCCLLISITSYAAEVRICNKSDVAFNNLYVNGWKYSIINAGECTNYYKDPMAQRYINVGIHLDGKSLNYASKGAPILLEEGRYSYQISLVDGHLKLETVKD